MGKKNVCFVCGKKETLIMKIKDFLNPSRMMNLSSTNFVTIGGKTFCCYGCYKKYMDLYSANGHDTWLEEAKRQNTYDRKDGGY